MTKFQPKRRFGQNFLIDRQIIEQIITGFGLNKADNVLEIGPGQAALTKKLANLQLCQLSCVEIDHQLAAELSCWLNPSSVYNEDFLSFDLNRVAVNDKLLRVVGNLPYCASSQIIIRCLDNLHSIADMNFMVQKEMADRLCAQPKTKEYGRLSVRAQVFCDVTTWLNVPAESFTPAPKVESAMVHLQPLEKQRQVDLSKLDLILREAFSLRRKQLKNSLKAIFTYEDLIELGVDPAARPEEITVEQYVMMSNSLT